MLLARQQRGTVRFSALQRAEIAERLVYVFPNLAIAGFSALQRAEIAESSNEAAVIGVDWVSVLFNEPKLLKDAVRVCAYRPASFQCSSTSRNC